jgi:hypothetical protein
MPMGVTFIIIAIASEVILVHSDYKSGTAVDTTVGNEAHPLSLGFDINLADPTISRGIQFVKVRLRDAGPHVLDK